MSENEQIQENIRQRLLRDIRLLVAEAKQSAAIVVNAAMSLLYWRVGKRLNEEVLRGKRAGYGEELVIGISKELTAEYGTGFSEKNLRRMRQFAEVYPDEEIVVSLIRQYTSCRLSDTITAKGNTPGQLHKAIEIARHRLSAEDQTLDE